MLTRPVTSDVLARLRDERDAADRAYNDALTAVDQALPRAPELPAPPASFDDHQIASINDSWRVLAGHALPAPRGLRSRLAHFVWRLVAPAFERQQAFNARLVDHLNRNVRSERETVEAVSRLTAAVASQTAALATFQSHLIQYFQRFTLYIDSRDRLEAAGLMAVYDVAINTVTDHVLMRAQAGQARDVRLDSRVADMAAAQDELRGSLAVLQQATFTLKREMERASAPVGSTAPNAPYAPNAPHAPAIDSYKYVGFEDRFRGSREDIRARLMSYVPLFNGRSDVLDVGCGRGEFLDLLREAGIGARGLDTNHEMVEVCRARGLDVVEGDLLSYLSGLPDGALGGLIAVQVVEHLDPSYLMRALDVAYHTLRPGSPIVLETINPASWFAFFSSYIRDLTHQRPIHPDTLQYLLSASGFQRARIEFRAPLRDTDKLQPLAPPAPTDLPALADLITTFNANVERLNGLLFAFQDYAAIAERL
jgi:SAM-dependent methyltransferase